MNDATKLTRYPDRADSRRSALNELLDEVLVATISTVIDGEPWSIPCLFARLGDELVIHGSTGAGLFRHVAHGSPCTVTVFALDGIVVAESAFDSSANYRSAVVRGDFVVAEPEDRDALLVALTDRLVPGRPSEVRRNRPKEIAATQVLKMALTDENWILKSRSGPSGVPDEPVTDTWAGVVPMSIGAGEPVTDEWVDPQVPVPASVQALVAAYPPHPTK